MWARTCFCNLRTSCYHKAKGVYSADVPNTEHANVCLSCLPFAFSLLLFWAKSVWTKSNVLDLFSVCSQTLVIGSYLIAHGCFSVYSMCVETIFICFCEYLVCMLVLWKTKRWEGENLVVCLAWWFALPSLKCTAAFIWEEILLVDAC